MSEDLVARLRRHAEMIKNDDCDAIEAGHMRPREVSAYRYEQQLAFEAAAAELVGLREQLARQAPVIRFVSDLHRANEILRDNMSSKDDMRWAFPLCVNATYVQHRIVGAYVAAVRAQSVPAPPEATEVTG